MCYLLKHKTVTFFRNHEFQRKLLKGQQQNLITKRAKDKHTYVYKFNSLNVKITNYNLSNNSNSTTRFFLPIIQFH